MVNQEAFKAVYELIVEFPELHDQGGWEAPPENTGRCGTTRCIAGWAVWWQACELGLLTKKRQDTDARVRVEIATVLGARNSWHDTLGELILGLSHEEADSLFHDMNDARAVARARSYAEHGHDLSEEERRAFDVPVYDRG